MKTIFQRSDNTVLESVHLLTDEFVVDGDLYLGHLHNDGIHILHTCGNAAILLRHTVAHGEPLQNQIVLGEGYIGRLGRCRNRVGDGIDL